MKNAVEMLNAYMQKANLKKIIMFNLFYLHFCFEILASEFVPWHGNLKNIILLHTHHTCATLHQKLFSSHHWQYTQDIMVASPPWT
jgi:hypothetical protein